MIDSLSFLEINSNDKIQASSYLIDYVQKEIDVDDLGTYMEAICKFYKSFLRRYYEVNSAIEENNMPKESNSQQLKKRLAK